ncbi:MAG: response regulator [Cyanobacteria bacterium REEB67]|nr:response regulator [Cyanobacteria bacterium REEB67]
MVEEPKIEPASPGARLAARNTYRILIMDSKENTDLLKLACKEAGHSVVAAQTIEEAFAFLDGEDHADVIICAAYLEDESLFEFLRRVRIDPIHKHSMFMTLALAAGPAGSKVNLSTERAGRLLGADVFVSMPTFDACVLIAEIKKLLPGVPVLEQERRDEEKREC